MDDKVTHVNEQVMDEVFDFVDRARYEDIVTSVKRGMPIDNEDDIEFLWDYKQMTPELMEMLYG